MGVTSLVLGIIAVIIGLFSGGSLGWLRALLVLQIKAHWKYTLEIYLAMYALLRFILEYLRYDQVRGKILIFSISQWISILLLGLSVLLILKKNVAYRIHR